MRKALEALTPEQRKRFQENLIKWGSLTPEDKTKLAEKDSIWKKRAAEEIDAAIKEAGLELDEAGREAFAKRYGAERRKIEQQLRAEMEEKRKPMLKEVIAKLKTEFSSTNNPGAVATTPAPVVAPPTVPGSSKP